MFGILAKFQLNNVHVFKSRKHYKYFQNDSFPLNTKLKLILELGLCIHESFFSVGQQNQNYQVLKYICVLNVLGVPLKGFVSMGHKDAGMERRKSAIKHHFPVCSLSSLR